MSRNIKFRVWVPHLKEMREVASIDFTSDTLKTKGDDTLFNFNESFADSFDTARLMQYIGLKDCKGREIYEGDIVKLTGDLEKVYKDEYNTISEVIFDDDDICFDAPKIACALNKHTCFEFEVIGNIYENSEWVK